MKHLNILVVITFFMGLFVFSACSKDDNPVTPLSRVIEQVKVYKGKTDEYKLEALVKLEYNQKDGTLSSISSPSFGEVTYRYDKEKFSYTHITTLEDGSDKVNTLSGNLINNRLNICNSKLLGNCVYAYDGTTGFLSQASVGSNIILNYKWQSDGLSIEAFSSNQPALSSLYSSKYHFSNVLNNYSVDLNVFPQLIDTRDEYDLIMNSYAQAAGVLGSKCKYVMEDISYEYTYSFDKYGRLSQLTLLPSLYGDSYTFVFIYKETIK